MKPTEALRIHDPAAVLAAAGLPDTPGYRDLLDDLDGLITVDLTERGRMRMAHRPDIEPFQRGMLRTGEV
jgi:hypothetical protein